MAIARNGINGAFSGKVGAVVGYTWKGIPVIRGLPKKSKKAPSDAQLSNRKKMAACQQFLKPIKEVLRKGFAYDAELRNITPYMAALSYNKLQAIIGEGLAVSLDHSKVKISRGPLVPPNEIAYKIETDGIRFTWDPSICATTKNGFDRILLLAYNVAGCNAEIVFGGATRGEGTFFCNWTKDRGHYALYAAFLSWDATQISDSVYLGTTQLLHSGNY